jgi:hypothetical protein
MDGQDPQTATPIQAEPECAHWATHLKTGFVPGFVDAVSSENRTVVQMGEETSAYNTYVSETIIESKGYCVMRKD